MTPISINSSTRLSDSVERELADISAAGTRAYSVIDGMAIVANAIGRGASAFGRYLVQVGEALNEARARDARFSGSQW